MNSILEECQGYTIAEIVINDMNYLDDDVRIMDTEEDIRMMATIQRNFAERTGMKFTIYKCANWGVNS